MRILITGAAGRLGSELAKRFSGKEAVLGVDTIAAEGVLPLDITHFDAVRRTVVDFQPDVVIHCAAWTDVDGCAREPEKAMLINAYGAQNMALAAAQVGAEILHVSTNEVFDGTQTTPYFEYDTRRAVNPYGHSKLAAERAVASVNPKHYITRTSWLFAHGGKNFIQAILNAVQAGKPLRVVTDEAAHPTYNNDLAEAITKLVATCDYNYCP